jgi:hypothetical protein
LPYQISFKWIASGYLFHDAGVSWLRTEASQRVSESAKTGFSGDFQRPNLTMRENFGAKSFQHALILNGLEIICKVLRGIYTPFV